MLNDEKYYLQVEQELKESKRDEALWSKSMTLAKDDEAEAKVQYIKARVAKLQKQEVGGKVKEKVNEVLPTILKVVFVFIAIILILEVTIPDGVFFDFCKTFGINCQY